MRSFFLVEHYTIQGFRVVSNGGRRMAGGGMGGGARPIREWVTNFSKMV